MGQVQQCCATCISRLVAELPGVFVVWLLADEVVPLVLGRTSPGGSLAEVVSLGMPLATLLWAGNVLATVIGRVRSNLARRS